MITLPLPVSRQVLWRLAVTGTERKRRETRTGQIDYHGECMMTNVALQLAQANIW
jgi:hypothetical protein